MSAEWSLEPPTGELLIRDIYSNNEPTSINIPAGWLRLRVSVHGRLPASQVQGQISIPVERHLLEIWPEEKRADPRLIGGPDELAGYLIG